MQQIVLQACSLADFCNYTMQSKKDRL